MTTSNNNNEQVTPFVLPRLDWYDAEGRIYKDALIENFNAIEDRFKELASIGEQLIGSSTGIDTSDIHLDDVTLESDNNKILNFRSFLNIIDMLNFPFEVVFNGKKLVKLSYFNSNYQLITITNKTLSPTNTNKYIYLNYNTGNVAASSASTSPTNSVLIGCYVDGSIKGLSSFNYASINALYYLAKMSEDIYPKTYTSGDRDNIHTEFGINMRNRCVGAADTDTGTSGSIDIIFRDIGRYE